MADSWKDGIVLKIVNVPPLLASNIYMLRLDLLQYFDNTKETH